VNPRQLKVIVTALVVLLVLWGASAYFHRSSDSLGGYVVPKLTPPTVDSVTLHAPGDTVILAKQESGAWTANGYRAALDGVKDFLGQLSDTAGAQLVAESPSSQARLGVDSASATSIRVEAGGKTLLTLLVGHMGSGYSSAYVRRPGAKQIYMVPQPLHSLVTRKVDAWRNKTIVQVPKDSASAVTVQIGRHSYTMTKAKTAWRFTNGAEADTTAVARLLGDLSDVTAFGFATSTEQKAAHFSRPDRSVTISGPKGGTLARLAFDSTADGFLVQSQGDSVIYKIALTLGRALTPADSTMVAPKAAAKPSANATPAPSGGKKK